MAWRYHGRQSPDPYNAKARGTCDRCGFSYSLEALNWQFDYRGDELTNTRFRVCNICMDKPYEGLRPVRIPPDPVPVADPRPENFAVDEGPTPTIPVWDQPGLLWDDGRTDWQP